jgi:hypothetical protein
MSMIEWSVNVQRLVQWELARERELLGENKAPVPLCPPDFSWNRTRAAAVGSRRLTAGAVAYWLRYSGSDITIIIVTITERAVAVVTLIRDREVLGSYFGPDTSYHEGFLVVFLGPPAKFRDSTLITPRLLPSKSFPNSPFICHPTIQRYILYLLTAS